MYSALSIADHIVAYHTGKEWTITNLRLQKLLYFIQAYFLTFLNRECFTEEMEAWKYGPVVPEVYEEYKCYGNSNIPYTGSSGNQRICREDIIVIDELLDHFSEYTANELVEITHNQDPWLMHYRPNRNAVIPKKSIKEYFEKQKQI